MIKTGDFHNAFKSNQRPKSILRTGVKQYPAMLVEVLSKASPESLSGEVIRTSIEGNLSLLSAEAFQFFLPAFMRICLEDHHANSFFASELVSSLTRPSRADIVQSIDLLEKNQRSLGVFSDNSELRRQQLEWFDSGLPTKCFQERVGLFTQRHKKAIIAFLSDIERRYSQYYPHGEIEKAIRSIGGEPLD